MFQLVLVHLLRHLENVHPHDSIVASMAAGACVSSSVAVFADCCPCEQVQNSVTLTDVECVQ